MVSSTIAYQKKNSFLSFLKWTDEKVALGDEIKKFIKPLHVSLLDIGAADGALTELIIGNFKHATLLEPSKTQYEILQNKFPSFETINMRVEDYQTDSRFSLILVSHVFQYISDPSKQIDKLLGLLTPGGVLLIVMADLDSEYPGFVKYFKGRVYDEASQRKHEFKWYDLVRILDDKHIPHEVRDVSASVKPPSVEKFLSINDFHFNIDTSNLSSSILKEMRDYIMRFEQESGLVLSNDHKVIAISAK